MTAKTIEQEIFKNRRRNGMVILRHVDLFKVCEQCNSVFGKDAGRCSICGAYNWKHGYDALHPAVIVSAMFYRTLPVLPRAITPVISAIDFLLPASHLS